VELDYLEYHVVPVVAKPKNNENVFRFLGTGFFVGSGGHLVTCAHIVNEVSSNESLYCFQIGKTRWIKLEIFRKMADHDLALCIGAGPETSVQMPLITEPFIQLGTDINVFGYVHEPKGPGKIPFIRRVMRGYITSIPESAEYPDSYELSFPALFGSSGAPVLHRFDVEGETDSKLGVVGCLYGTRESSVVRHSQIVLESSRVNGVERETEVTARIVELGLAYNVRALNMLFKESELSLPVYGELNS